MSTQKVLLSCTISLAIFGLSTPTIIMATPNVCIGGQYTVNYQGQDTITYPGQIAWNYSVLASQTALNAVKEAIMIPPRPVAPTNIMSPQAALGYCVERDSNTKVNRGNCNGFPLPVPLTKSGNSATFQVITDKTVKEGLVALVLVSGSASSDTCINSDDPLPKGIPGPATIDSAIQPIAWDKCTTVQGTGTSILTKYGPDSCISQVTAFENSNCSTEEEPGFVLPAEQVDGLLYAGPIDGGQTCASTLTVKTGSPCYLTSTTSGGKTYKYCVDAATGKLVDTALCTTHTGVCH